MIDRHQRYHSLHAVETSFFCRILVNMEVECVWFPILTFRCFPPRAIRDHHIHTNEEIFSIPYVSEHFFDFRVRPNPPITLIMSPTPQKSILVFTRPIGIFPRFNIISLNPASQPCQILPMLIFCCFYVIRGENALNYSKAVLFEVGEVFCLVFTGNKAIGEAVSDVLWGGEGQLFPCQSISH